MGFALDAPRRLPPSTRPKRTFAVETSEATVGREDRRSRVDIEGVTSVAVITPDAALSRRLYVNGLGLPLKQLDGDYFASEEISGCRHFGVWPLTQAAEACFG